MNSATSATNHMQVFNSCQSELSSMNFCLYEPLCNQNQFQSLKAVGLLCGISLSCCSLDVREESKIDINRTT